MIKQESSYADEHPFVEEEISEALLEPLGWRAEGRASRSISIRGGVVADEVGYGKTAITLGLIDCTSDRVPVVDVPGRVSVKATVKLFKGQ